jgi:5-methylthioadenosine/S-adenosylhomocysteine deaminase
MPTIHIKNVDILTLDDQGSILKNSNLVVRDSTIAAVGEIPPGLAADEIVDASGKAAMPGLVNSHCHSPMTILRGWAEDMLFPTWLQKVWSAENHLTAEDIYWAASLAAAEMIRSGTVAFADLYFFMDQVTEVVDQSGLKALLGWGVFDAGLGTSAGAMLEQTIEWIKEVKARGNPRIKTILGPHSPYTCSPQFLERFVQYAHDLDLGIHLHVAESQAQVDESLQKYGCRPVQHVDQLGVFDVPGGCISAHTIYIDERDTEILAEKGVFVPHCPNTYMKLAMPFPSLKARLDARVKVCLGTDGPASNASMDMFASIRQTALIHKYLQRDPQMMPGDQALRLATRAGAEALGLENSGIIREGAAADIILVNLDAPHMRPVHDLVANLVHCTKGGDVMDVMADGRWLMKEGVLLTLDEERVIFEAQKRALALVEKVKN